MAIKKELSYKISPNWKVFQDGDKLRLHGGADAEYEVELSNGAPSTYAENQAFTRRVLSESDESVFEQMFTAGVIVPVGKKYQVMKVAFVGDELPFNIDLPKRLQLVAGEDEADTVVVVRYTSTHQEMAQKYHKLAKPYLYFDIAYHHTVSVGPLVYAGETVCLGCLYGRIKSRWGDEKPPKSPRVAGYSILATAILVTELSRVIDADNSLVGQVVAWDIDGRRVTTDKLLKTSLCPQCGKSRLGQPTVVLWD